MNPVIQARLDYYCRRLPANVILFSRHASKIVRNDAIPTLTATKPGTILSISKQ